MPGLRLISPLGLGVLGAVMIAGCGFGTSPHGDSASLLVTRNFGDQPIGHAVQQHVPASETVLSWLEHSFRVGTRAGGAAVSSINGHADAAGRVQWSVYVNGIETPKGAALTDVNPGDHIWWDLHSQVGSTVSPAIVGDYPEPFTTGLGGKEFPTLLNCADGMQAQCNLVGASLHRAGVKAPDQLIGTGSGSDSLAVVVGTWSQVQGIIAAELIAAGPAHSGVYAQFVGSRGAALELDAPDGTVARTLHGSVGLIAATGNELLGQPTWFVTGSDAAGVAAAARAFTAAKLDGHFAVAVSGSHVIPVPVDASS